MIMVKEIYKFINDIAPFNSSFDWDNTGLLIGDMGQNVSNVLVALDVTKEVISEAVDFDCNLIISHHPVIFKPVKNILNGSIPYLAVKNNLNVICAHTNLDLANEGVNKCLANKLNLKNIRPLCKSNRLEYNKIIVFSPPKYENDIIKAMSENGAGKLGNYSMCSFISDGTGRFLPESGAKPYIGEKGVLEEVKEVKIEMICPENRTKSAIKAMKAVHPYEEPAYDVFKDFSVYKEYYDGIIGDLEVPMDSIKFAEFIKEKLNCEGLRYTEIDQKIIKKVALCGGAGGNYIRDAVKSEADAFVTGEIKHSDILEANHSGVMVVDAGHFKTENLAIDNFKNILEKKFKEITFYKSEVLIDKIKYLHSRFS
ncbi:MAG: Nif3-like dinuclear metal center hexameric protein [Oscillospiraceae bacterium]|jgi:dinuclear metal center YbgI/SA1388 family protein|nr:Nif3-like dinuclear metal center hexameric protein [Oscillospiraceae bacterium]